MRVLMVTDFYWPLVGGVEQHVRSLSHALVDRGHDVAVVSLAADDTGPSRELDGPVRVYRIPSVSRLLGPKGRGRAWSPPFVDPLSALAMRRVASLERPDVVHGHDWLSRSAWLACGRRPLVVSLHYYTASCAKKTLVRGVERCPGPGPVRCIRCAAEHYGTVRGPVIAVGNAVSSRLELRHAGAVIGVSTATLEGNRVGGHPLAVVVPNSLPAAALDPPLRSHARWPAGLPDGPFILYVGDRRSEKGLPVLLAAHRRLAPGVPLVVIGKPLGDVQLPEGETGVVQLGPMSNEDVRRAFRQATVAVVPSTWEEPFGIVLLEAMAAGAAIVASRVGGIPEVVQDDVTALLVPPGDADALASALQRLLDDPALRSRLTSAAALAAPRFDAAIVAEEVERQYVAAVRRSRATRRWAQVDWKAAVDSTRPWLVRTRRRREAHGHT